MLFHWNEWVDPIRDHRNVENTQHVRQLVFEDPNVLLSRQVSPQWARPHELHPDHPLDRGPVGLCVPCRTPRTFDEPLETVQGGGIF